jgi:hypothetical protein
VEGASSSETERTRTADFGSLSRKIAGRTTDLIAIGLVIIGGLSMGRQIVEWWGAEPPVVGVSSATEGDSTPWGTGSTPVDLEFGDYPLSLRREVVAGDQVEAMKAVVNACRFALQSTADADWPAEDAAGKLLERVDAETPVAEEPGEWQIFQIEKPFALVLGVRLLPKSVPGERNDATGSEPMRKLACWGMATPLGEKRWTTYMCQPVSGNSRSADREVDPALPEGSRRLLSLRGASGAGLIGFSGRGVPREWTSFFDAQLGAQGWETRGGWSSGAETWSARYEPVDAGRRAVVDISFSRDDAGELRGLIQIVR